ncbi:MAG: hypothetical protein IT335_03450 [Thermomicrobiales bacterium]|jgi:maleate isomerase|nr:hypothetical protein [Thermomicrobiales bacterium]
MFGERGRIGLITLATDTGVLPEFQRLMPDGVQVYPAPIVLPRGEVTAASLSEMLEGDQLERAASLLAWAEVDVILFACTSGSLVNGPGWDQQLSQRITAASGIPATTTTSAVLAALRDLDARRLVIATPYLDEINDIERDFFSRSGFEVLAIAGLQCATDYEIGRLSPADAGTLLDQMRRTPPASGSPAEQKPFPISSFPFPTDAIFISCTNWHVVETIAGLEQQYGIPVVSSNLAGAWQALRLIYIDEPLKTLTLRGATL